MPVGVIVGTSEKLEDTADVKVVLKSGTTGDNILSVSKEAVVELTKLLEILDPTVREEETSLIEDDLNVEVLYVLLEVVCGIELSTTDPARVSLEESVTVTLGTGEILDVEVVAIVKLDDGKVDEIVMNDVDLNESDEIVLGVVVGTDGSDDAESNVKLLESDDRKGEENVDIVLCDEELSLD